MKLGDLVTLTLGPKAGRPYVVVHEPVRGRVRLCYCGADRWYVPAWHDVDTVKTEIPADNQLFRRARFLLSEVTADPDGWKRLLVGREGQLQKVIVGHISQDEDNQPNRET